MVEVSISRWGQFKGTEADVVKRFVVDTKGFVGVFDQLVNGEGGIVRFHNCIGHLQPAQDGKQATNINQQSISTHAIHCVTVAQTTFTSDFIYRPQQ